jgi:hypothetical protein
MLDDLFAERCTIAAERHIAAILDAKPDEFGWIYANDAPWSHHGCGFAQAGIPSVVREIIAAYTARVWFNGLGLVWARPLPLAEECSALLRSRGAAHLLGLYGVSLQHLSYDFLRHPHPNDYFSGVLAHPAAPSHILTGELLETFPPKELAGLDNYMLWSDPAERIAA